MSFLRVSMSMSAVKATRSMSPDLKVMTSDRKSPLWTLTLSIVSVRESRVGLGTEDIWVRSMTMLAACSLFVSLRTSARSRSGEIP